MDIWEETMKEPPIGALCSECVNPVEQCTCFTLPLIFDPYVALTVLILILIWDYL